MSRRAVVARAASATRFAAAAGADRRRGRGPPPRARTAAAPMPNQSIPNQPVAVQQPAAPLQPQSQPLAPTPSRSLPTRMTVTHDQMFSAGFRFGLGFCLASFVFSVLFMLLLSFLVTLGLLGPFVVGPASAR
ncbi:MAG: hypothetical protein RIC55_30910 [Pirellulaceae bacterium]